MHLKYTFLVFLLALIQPSLSRPQNKSFASKVEPETKGKEWEMKKSDISLLKQMEKSGLGAKRSLADDKEIEKPKVNTIENIKNDEELKASEELGESDDQSSARIKKQSPLNVCIKMACGKTVCGPVVSARGPAVGEMRAMIHNIKPISALGDLQSIRPISALGDLQSSVVNEINQAASKMDRYSPMQGRTVDLLNVSPLSVGYNAASVFQPSLTPSSENNALGYGHSFIKPPPVTTVPAVPVAVISQHQPHHPPMHPWLMPHLLPHVMPHLMPNLMPSLMPSLTSFVTPHRFEMQHFAEIPQNDIKQPASSLPPFSYHNPDTALICQPVRNQRFDTIYDYSYKPDVAADKSLNVSDSARKIQTAVEEEGKISDHLKKVNEIKEEISQLNRAAQRIVDQQERLTEMQQKHLWGGSSMTPTMREADHSMSSMPYMGSSFYSHPSWGFSRSNILSYPNTHDDMDFFMNLLRAGKKFGVISDSLQPGLNNVADATKGTQGATKNSKEIIENINAKIETTKPPTPSSI